MKMILGNRQTLKLLPVAAIILAVSLSFLSCGRGPDEEMTSTGIKSTVLEVPCPENTPPDITVQDEAFTPAEVTVPVNSIVKWTNNDLNNKRYWVISDNVPDGSFKITAIYPGASACLTFTAPGTYLYHCDDGLDGRPYVGGTVIVTAPTTSGQ